MRKQNQHSDQLAFYSSTLGLVEVSLGSALHYFKIPFTGQILNLNQIYFMNLISFHEKRKFSGLELSTIVAIIKSIGPVGKKITPMIAIFLQGLFYSFGLMLLGPNLYGQVLGSIISSLWPIIQMILVYYLLYGSDIIDIIQITTQKFSKFTGINSDYLIVTIIGLIVIKLILASVLPFIAKTKGPIHSLYMNWIRKLNYKKNNKNFLKGFIIFFIGYILFTFYSVKNYHIIFIKILRPVGIMIIFNYAVSKVNISNVVMKLPNSQFKSNIINVLKSWDK